ncbi:hypothetical protein H8790_09695 [Oscillibacter hominis]|uniref:Uncharacterized protein n=1 Tax=Oscillibacter hominis TaxID=2763056 RepID=A0A7G9B2F7_9FIRM|nr:hypothetical protein [Oscillibacter hominis]QNL43738.1 hypothetical protein H8790_09695 [Oscillibacter hominis]
MPGKISVSVGTVPGLTVNIRPLAASGGTLDHSVLQNRDKEDQHPIASITDLKETLDSKLGLEDALSNAQLKSILGW